MGAGLRAEMNQMEAGLRADMSKMEAGLRRNLEGQGKRFDDKLSAFSWRLITFMGAGFVSMAGLLVTRPHL